MNEQPIFYKEIRTISIGNYENIKIEFALPISLFNDNIENTMLEVACVLDKRELKIRNNNHATPIVPVIANTASATLNSPTPVPVAVNAPITNNPSPVPVIDAVLINNGNIDSLKSLTETLKNWIDEKNSTARRTTAVKSLSKFSVSKISELQPENYNEFIMNLLNNTEV